MTLQQLRYLIAVAEQGSINAASRALYISQSSLSVSIKELEEEAFIDFANEREEDSYEFVLRETRTADVIEDVRTFRSDLGILYLSTYNRRVVGKRLEGDGLCFTSLFRARPHALVREGHPLAHDPYQDGRPGPLPALHL